MTSKGDEHSSRWEHAHLLLRIGLVWASIALFGGLAEPWDHFLRLLQLGAAALWLGSVWVRPRGIPPGVGVALLLLLWGALALIPLGGDVVNLLSPWLVATRQEAGLPPGGPLSALPSATLTLLLSWALAVIHLWALHDLLHSEGQRRRALRGLAAGVLVFLGLAVVQRLGSAAHIYFVSDIPRVEGTPFLGSFVSRNHAATLLGSGLFVCVGMARRTHPASKVWLLAAALMGVALGASSSWGGLLATLAAGSVWLGLTLARRSVWAGICGGWSMAILAGVIAGPHRLEVLTGLASSPASMMSRLGVWRDVLTHMIPQAPLTGLGAGTFRYTYPAFKHTLGWANYHHTHSEPLQLVVELGLGGLIAGLALLVVGGKHLGRLAKAPPHPRGLAFALVASALVPLFHGLVDFPFGLPALLLWTLTVWGVVLRLTPVPTPATSPGLTRGVALLLGAGVFLAGWRVETDQAAAETSHLSLNTFLDSPPPPAPEHDPLQPRPEVTPGGSDIPVELAEKVDLLLLLQLGDRAQAHARQDLDHSYGHLLRALDLYHVALTRAPWLGLTWRGRGWTRLYLQDPAGARRDLLRATELDPTDPAGWRLLARLYRVENNLAEAGPAYRQAVRYSDERYRFILFEEMEKTWPDSTHMLALLPEDPAIWLELARWLRSQGRWRDVRQVLEEARPHYPTDLNLVGDLAVACLRLGDVACAEKALGELKHKAPEGFEISRLEGDVAAARGESGKALAYYRLALRRSPEATQYARVLTTLATQKAWGEVEKQADAALIDLRHQGGETDRYQTALIYRYRAEARYHRGDIAGARGDLDQAVDLIGELPEIVHLRKTIGVGEPPPKE